MRRLGFVKLSSYGLVLTPEGRIISLRPAILDDGLGGRIVGWKAGDLAAMELEKWEPARPAAKAAVATRVATPRPPAMTRPMPLVVLPHAVEPTGRMPAIIAAPAPTPPAPAPVVAAEPEDDWEWTIAIARARAAADEVAVAAAQVPAPVAASTPRRVRADTVPPPATTPVTPMAARSSRSMPKVDADGWPTTEALGELDYNDYTNPALEVARVRASSAVGTPSTPTPVVVTTPAPAPARVAAKGTLPSVLRPAAVTQQVAVVPVATARPAPRASTSPSTVIPVPKLPTLASTPNMTHIAPVVRSALPTPMMPSAPRRMAKGTGPVVPQPATLAPVPGDETVPNIPLAAMSTTRPIPSIRRAASQS